LRLPPDPRFHEQRKRFDFRFACEHCALFDPERERCAHGFPTEDHRVAHYASLDAVIVLCKDFQIE